MFFCFPNIFLLMVLKRAMFFSSTTIVSLSFSLSSTGGKLLTLKLEDDCDWLFSFEIVASNNSFFLIWSVFSSLFDKRIFLCKFMVSFSSLFDFVKRPFLFISWSNFWVNEVFCSVNFSIALLDRWFWFLRWIFSWFIVTNFFIH